MLPRPLSGLLIMLAVLVFASYFSKPPALSTTRRVLAARQQLEGVTYQSRPSTTPSQLSSFRNCLNEFSSKGSSSSSSKVVTEAGSRPSGSLKVTLTNENQYGYLQNLNAQTRGTKNLQPVAFAEPGSTADVAAVVKCANSAGLRFAPRNGGHQVGVLRWTGT